MSRDDKLAQLGHGLTPEGMPLLHRIPLWASMSATNPAKTHRMTNGPSGCGKSTPDSRTLNSRNINLVTCDMPPAMASTSLVLMSVHTGHMPLLCIRYCGQSMQIQYQASTFRLFSGRKGLPGVTPSLYATYRKGISPASLTVLLHRLAKLALIVHK